MYIFPEGILDTYETARSLHSSLYFESVPKCVKSRASIDDIMETVLRLGWYQGRHWARNCFTSRISSSLLECIIPWTPTQSLSIAHHHCSDYLVRLELVIWKDFSEFLRGELTPLVGNHRVTVAVGLIKTLWVVGTHQRVRGGTWR